VTIQQELVQTVHYFNLVWPFTLSKFAQNSIQRKLCDFSKLAQPLLNQLDVCDSCEKI